MELKIVTEAATGRANRFPALWKRNDGSLILVYQEISGVDRFRAERRCHVMLSSSDNGKNWCEEKRFFHWERKSGTVTNASTGDMNSPGDFCRFSELPDGRLVYYGQSPSGGLLYVSRDEFRDDEREWKIIRPSFEGTSLSVKLYHLRVLPGGEWAMAGTWLGKASSALDTRIPEGSCDHAGLLFLTSCDEGKNWKIRSTLYDGKLFPFHLCEPSWSIYHDGSFHMFTRDQTGYGPGLEFISNDAGHSWTASPMRFMGHHIYADSIRGGKIMASFRACHHIRMPAVGLWLDDGGKWGRFLHLDDINMNCRYHSDVSQWIELPDGNYMVAYSLPPDTKLDVGVKVAKFSTCEFTEPDVKI